MLIAFEAAVRKTRDLPAGLALLHELLSEVGIGIPSDQEKGLAACENLLVNKATCPVAGSPGHLGDVENLLLSL